jgi:hypothetical protein
MLAPSELKEKEYLDHILGPLVVDTTRVDAPKSFNDSPAFEKLKHLYRCVMYRFFIQLFAEYHLEQMTIQQNVIEHISDYLEPVILLPKLPDEWESTKSIFLSPEQPRTSNLHFTLPLRSIISIDPISKSTNHVVYYRNNDGYSYEEQRKKERSRLPIFSCLEKMQMQDVVFQTNKVWALHVSHNRKYIQALVEEHHSRLRMIEVKSDSPIWDWSSPGPSIVLDAKPHSTCPPLANNLSLISAWFDSRGSQLNLLHARRPLKSAKFGILVWTKIQLKHISLPLTLGGQKKIPRTKGLTTQVMEQQCYLSMDPRYHSKDAAKFCSGFTHREHVTIVGGGPACYQNVVSQHEDDENEVEEKDAAQKENDELRLWISTTGLLQNKNDETNIIGYLSWKWKDNQQRWAENPWILLLNKSLQPPDIPMMSSRSYYISRSKLLTVQENTANGTLQLATSLEDVLTNSLRNSTTVGKLAGDLSGLSEYWNDWSCDTLNYNLEWVFELKPHIYQRGVEISIYHPIFKHMKITYDLGTPNAFDMTTNVTWRFCGIYNIAEFNSARFWIDYLCSYKDV